MTTLGLSTATRKSIKALKKKINLVVYERVK
jgi:hypothetical protein